MPDDPLSSSPIGFQDTRVNYARLAKENLARYGTDWPRIGGMLLADRYADQTHFIYELLQNAEDALRKRGRWGGKRSVKFELDERCLRVSHFGKPFEERDVRGICGISESTKDLTAIGRFGIGFKSVHAFTDRPEVHSGAEDFAVEGYICPVAVNPVERDPDETVILIPLRSAEYLSIIAAGLASLGANALLFLRAIDQIEWSVADGDSGLYLRDQPTADDGLARRVKVIGEQKGHPEIEEDWLIFSQPMSRTDGDRVGNIEVAFRLEIDLAKRLTEIRRVSRSMLSVFFPTVVETHLGFLLQGPFRTTPSRDAVPPTDDWNVRCVQEAANLVAEALRWLRDKKMLNVSALNSLPIEWSKFEGAMFAPVYEQVKSTLSTEPLLPDSRNSYLSARQALLGRGQDLRNLLDEQQLVELFPEAGGRGWLSASITLDRTPELRNYLIRELRIQEVVPDTVLARLKTEFLEQQPDDWIEHLYVFLDSQHGLRATASGLPLVRRTDGSHVRAQIQGVPQVYLSGSFASGFPTVRSTVCQSVKALSFLTSLGLTVPDRVDDVVMNVLPKYRGSSLNRIRTDYAEDVARIVAAFKTDSRSQRDKLVSELADTPFVRAVSAVNGRTVLARPDITVLATDRLKDLLSGIDGEFIVDDREACLRGADVRDMLESCGSSRHLRVIKAPDIDGRTRQALREKSGYPITSGINDRVTDFMLSGLTNINGRLKRLDVPTRARHAELLWDELGLIAERRKSAFTAEYSWSHYGHRRTPFPATFVSVLNEACWVPGPGGELYPPSAVLFESLGWTPDAFLLTQIRFKPPIIAQLAEEAGFEPAALDLLKRLGLTSEADLRAILKIKEAPPPALAESPQSSSGRMPIDAEQPSAISSLPLQTDTQASGSVRAGTSSLPPRTQPGENLRSKEQSSQDPNTAGLDPVSHDPKPADGSRPTTSDDEAQTGDHKTGGGTSEQSNHREFISFIGVRPDDDDSERESDPDGLAHEKRMALEDAAITLILSQEPKWQRTPTGNPGYDLVAPAVGIEPCVWCEVKAMTGSLDHRPVGMSKTQFEFAQSKGLNSWLYIVEHAGSEKPNILRIRDPAGQSRTFTFDRGWRTVGEKASRE